MIDQPEKKPENIFEAVSEFEKKRHEKGRGAKTDTEQQNEAVRALFQRCKEMYEDLSAKIDRTFERSGITESQYRAYISRPQNFSDKDWSRLQAQKISNVARLQKLAPHAPIPKTEEIVKPLSEEKPPQPPLPSPKATVSGKRKPIRKSGWLEMR